MTPKTRPWVQPSAESSQPEPRKIGIPRAKSSRLRVLHIISDLSVGGAEMVLYKLLSMTDEERFSPIVLSLKNRGRLCKSIESLGIPVYSVAMRLPMPTPTSVWRLVRLARQLKADVIQGWMSHGNLAAQLAGAFLPDRVPVLWNIRQSLYSLDYEKLATALAIKLGARLSHKPAIILYNSRTSAAQHETIGYRNDKMLVIHNGFDTDLFVPSTVARRSLRSELGVADNTVLIGLVGRYHPVKDHSNFLHAAALLLQGHPDVQFVLSGRGVCWGNHHLREMIQRLGLVERIHLLGERQDMPRIMGALDIATSSSYAEGFPNVIGEAMACGVPCVVTDISDLPWLVGETGKVVQPRDPHALASALRELIEIGHDGRRMLGHRARARIMEYFHLDYMVMQYEALYERVAAPQGIEGLRADMQYQRLLEQIPSNVSRSEASGRSADVQRSRA